MIQIGSGMPAVIDGKSIPIAPVPPTPQQQNIEIIPAIGEPKFQGQNPDFVADYIFCNNINITAGVPVPSVLNGITRINTINTGDGYSPFGSPDWFQFHNQDSNWGNIDIWAYDGLWVVNNGGQFANWDLWASADTPISGNRAEFNLNLTTTSGGYAGILYQRLGALAGPNHPLWIQNINGDIVFATSSSTSQPGWYVGAITGMFYPNPTNAIDVGTPANKIRNLFVAGAVANRTKAGIPVDADVNTPTDGMLIVDTTNNKIMVRIGGVWKGVVVA